jgi:type IV secretion system protein VirD4
MQQNPILIGRTGSDYHHFNGSEHAALYARTGTGKSSSVVIPNCFAWRGSLVVLDVKSEAFKATAGYRKRVLGQDVYLFDPAAENERTHRWNPLQPVQRDSTSRFDQISRQAFMLFPDSSIGSSSNAEAFWIPSARGAFIAVATLLAETPGADFTVANVLRMFARSDSRDVLARMIKQRRATGGPGYSQIAIDGLSDYLGGSADQAGGIRKMTSTRLQAWFNPRIAASTATSDFDIRRIRRRPMTIYVTVQPGNIARMRPVLSLFFDALVNLNTDVVPEDDPAVKWQTLVLLDEFIRLGKMESLSEAAQYVRGYGLRFLYVIQSKAQLRAKYGPDAAEDLFDNTGCEIVFGTNDLKLTKELSERMGDDTINVVTKNRPRWLAWMNWAKQSEAEHPHRRPLMLPQEIARLSPSEQLILRPGMLPAKTAQARWYDDPHFTSCVRPPPEIPRLNVVVAEDDGQTQMPTNAPRLPAITAADVVPETEEVEPGP